MVATASTVGAIGGTIVAGKLADAFGRRTTLLVTSFYSIVGSAFSAYSSSFNFILIGRLISGFGIGHYSTIVPIYIAECAESKKRGTLSTVPQLMVNEFVVSFEIWDQPCNTSIGTGVVWNCLFLYFRSCVYDEWLEFSGYVRNHNYQSTRTHGHPLWNA